MRALLSAPSWPSPPVWCDGHLHDLDLVLDTSSDPTGVGVIHVGDVARGDPAVDLCVLWTTFEAAHRGEAGRRLAANGGYDEAVWRRARGWAAAFVLAVAGDERGLDELAATVDDAWAQPGCL